MALRGTIVKAQIQTNKVVSSKRKHPVLITIGVIFAVFIGLYIYEELHWHSRFNVVQDEVEKIRKDVIEPAGGIADGSDARGSTPWEFWKCMDVACPNVSQAWNVPIESGKEADFIKMVFAKEGYPVESPPPSYCKSWQPGDSCDASSRKGNLYMSVSIGPVSQVPAKDVSPFVWRSVGISLSPWDTQKPLP